jgi:3-methyl-2-oxobutanoate hydroxymethyltransferase
VCNTPELGQVTGGAYEDFTIFIAVRWRAKKISMVTCYDYWSAQLLNDSELDTLLVGDSLAMVMHGL